MTGTKTIDPGSSKKISWNIYKHVNTHHSHPKAYHIQISETQNENLESCLSKKTSLHIEEGQEILCTS